MSTSPIDENEIDHLAQLARLELYPEEKQRFAKDLQAILGYFEELKSLDTQGVAPMNGGTLLQNVLRDDNARHNTNRGAGAEEFPERQGNYLKVPPIFEQE